jgi:hypothetical protein
VVFRRWGCDPIVHGEPAADALRVTRRRRNCPSCGERPDRLRAYRWKGRAYCGASCRNSVRDAYRKTQHDIKDRARHTCRCPGAPQPLEPRGDHCVHCRRLFSAGVQVMLAEGRRRRHVSLDRIRDLLYHEFRARPKMLA